MDRHINQQLIQVVARTRRLRRWTAMSVLWCILALAAAGAWFGSLAPSVVGSVVIGVLAVGCVGTLWLWRPTGISPAEQLEVARAVENTFPDLEQRLITVVEQTPDVTSGGYSYLQQQLATEVRCHSYGHEWTSCIPLNRIMSRMLLAFAAIGMTLFIAGRMHATQPEPLIAQVDSQAIPDADLGQEGSRFVVSVDPGNAEVERGTSLTIVAKFDGPLPSSISMLQAGAGIQATSIPMQQSLDEPLFGVRLPSVKAPFEYRVQFDDETSETFQVNVFELPRVEQVDARVEFPTYAGMPAELIEDTWQIAAVEGSTAVLVCRLNKEIASGFLVSESDERFELKLADGSFNGKPEASASVQLVEAGSDTDGSDDLRTASVDGDGPSNVANADVSGLPLNDDVFYVARVPVTKSMRLRFDLADDKGRKNREDDEFLIDALPNRPAEITLTFPAKDVRVSPIEELQLEATVWDDFGLRDHGIILAVADDADRTISLGEEASAREQHQLAHLVEMELTGAEPDQLVSYYFFADDVAADGTTRRTLSDMFFAEVRHFEEIFREGQAPPGGQQQQQQQQQQGGKNAQQAEKLAELQKQIITATWNIIRRETKPEVSSSFADDTQLLIESQQQALEQLAELAEKLKDGASKKYAQQAAEAMTSAAGELQQAIDGSAAAPLSPAMKFERSAYQTLLKLRAREHEVTKQQGGGGGSGGAQGGSKQQMQQLELDNKKNRYEAESQAGQKQTAQQQQQNKETLQALNRLRELARRQGDLNEKLRELEHALREAETDEEREEIERQLKRLRDEQRDLLKDVDELRNRMDKPENQQQMTDSKRQLENTRSRVRQTSEALEKGQLSQALNSGKRAERELEDLRDDMRQKAAGQFGDAMRDLRDQAREIGERQDRIAEQLKGDEPDPDERRSLRSGQDRDTVQKDLDDQKKQLDNVLNQMREVVEKAETAEPLLARELYDAVRKTRADRPGDALDESRNLVRRGLVDQASEAEQRAHEGIDRLQKGIERAAESVLGNELETLRRAQQQLADAADSVETELAQADPSQARPARDGEGESNPSASGEARSDTLNPDGSEPGTQSNPEGQEGQPGQSKPGEQQPGQPGEQGNPDGQQGTNQNPQGNQKPSGQPGEQKPGEQNPGDQKPGEQKGSQPGEGSKPGEQSGGQKPGEGKPGQPQERKGDCQQPQSGQPSQSPNGQQPGQNPSQQQPSNSPSEQQKGSQPGGQKPGQSPSSQTSQSPGSQSPGQTPSESQSQSDSQSQSPGGGRGQGNQRQQPGLRQSPNQQPGPRQETASNQGGNQSGPGNPLTGRGFQEWSDQLRNIEEMVDDPKLRAEVAQVREAARSMRVEFKRHSKEPEWDLVRTKILEPLTELQQRVREEIARRESPDSLVPIDRDPVPDRYADLVRRYLERVGSGK